MKEVALILASHGQMAQETLKTAEMILGKHDGVYALAVNPADSSEHFAGELARLVAEIQHFKHIVIMVDIIGGTPCNVAINQLSKGKNVEVISGFNLPMVLEFITSRENDFQLMKEDIITLGKTHIRDLTAELEALKNEVYSAH